jgi:DNA-binding CsgD family transcriptional regulator
MARARVLGGTPAEAISPLEAVLTEARAIGDQELVIRALTSQSMAQRFLGHFEKSVELAAEAVAGFEPHPATRHADPRVWLARSFMATDRLEEADDLGHALMRDTTTITRHHPDLPLLSATTARLLLAQGRVRDAHTEAESGIAAMDAEGGRELATELFACLALAGWYVDGASAAKSALERSSELTGHDRFGMNHLELAALLVSEDRDHDHVGALAAPLLDELQRSGGQLVFDPAHGPSIVRTLIAAGLTSEASLVVDACHRLADLNPQIASWQAAHDHAAGLNSDDVDVLRAAARTFATCGRPLASALTEADIAAALRRREDPDWAAQRQEAVSLLRSLGADAAAAKLEHDMPSGSGSSRRRVREQRPDTGWESLTPAELRVVAVAATGATNKEIAAELWISPYTVDTHMRHILGKLGVRSRVAVARLAAERDLEGGTREQ